MPGDVVAGMPDGDNRMDIRAGLQRLVDIGLEADMLAAANRLVGRANTTECTAPMRAQASMA
jgi:hypothetical protein